MLRPRSGQRGGRGRPSAQRRRSCARCSQPQSDPPMPRSRRCLCRLCCLRRSCRGAAPAPPARCLVLQCSPPTAPAVSVAAQGCEQRSSLPAEKRAVGGAAGPAGGRVRGRRRACRHAGGCGGQAPHQAHVRSDALQGVEAAPRAQPFKVRQGEPGGRACGAPIGGGIGCVSARREPRRQAQVGARAGAVLCACACRKWRSRLSPCWRRS